MTQYAQITILDALYSNEIGEKKPFISIEQFGGENCLKPSFLSFWRQKEITKEKKIEMMLKAQYHLPLYLLVCTNEILDEQYVMVQDMISGQSFYVLKDTFVKGRIHSLPEVPKQKAFQTTKLERQTLQELFTNRCDIKKNFRKF